MWTKKNEIEHLKDCMKKRDELIKHFTDELKEAAKKRDELRVQLAEKDEEIAGLKKRCEELKNKIAEKNEDFDMAIKRKDELLKGKNKEIVRLNQQLTERDLYEKKKDEVYNMTAKDSHEPDAMSYAMIALDRICRLEAKIEAQENPYFF